MVTQIVEVDPAVVSMLNVTWFVDTRRGGPFNEMRWSVKD